MKTGCYICRDERVVLPEWAERHDPVVHLFVDAELGEVALKNFAGNRGARYPIPDDDKRFVDDEKAGTIVLPTEGGLIFLYWPTEELLTAIAHDFPPDFPSYLNMTEEEVQAKLYSYCDDGLGS